MNNRGGREWARSTVVIKEPPIDDQIDELYLQEGDEVASFEEGVEEGIPERSQPVTHDDEGTEMNTGEVSSYPFRIGTSQKAGVEMLIAVTEDCKTWRKRSGRLEGNILTEFFVCVACEAISKRDPSALVPRLVFRYSMSTAERTLLTNPASREHSCDQADPSESHKALQRSRPQDLPRKRVHSFHLDMQPGPSAQKIARDWPNEEEDLTVDVNVEDDDWVEEGGEEEGERPDTVNGKESSTPETCETETSADKGGGDENDEVDVSEPGPNPAAAAHRRRLMKQKKRACLVKEEGESGTSLSMHDDEGGFAEAAANDKPKKADVPAGGYPFKTGLSSKGSNGTLIVITDDGKTWRRRNIRKKSRGKFVTEYFNCISCESMKKQVPEGKFPTLTFLYTPSSDTRVLLTDPHTRIHICGSVRSSARTTAEQLVRKRKAVAKLAGIKPVHAYESAAYEAQDIGESEHWDNSFLSNVLEEIVTRTPRRPRDRLIHNMAVEGTSGLAEASRIYEDHTSTSTYPPEFPPELAAEIKALVSSSRGPANAGSWQLYTGDGIIVFVRH